MAERLLTITEVAERLQVPPATIYYWRGLGRGPRGARVGRHVRYREADVADYIECIFAGTAT
ncbi:MAG: DNA-binding protein [Acidimicrobiia bacterium]|nr:DNA-binding protein [Acidimicrobiia bacterium]